MRVGPRVLVLARDAAGYGAALTDALLPTPGLTRDSAPFALPLTKYGLYGEKASGELVSFSDSSGSPQVLQCIGDHLARHISLEFSKETVLERGIEKTPIVQEPWRELYG